MQADVAELLALRDGEPLEVMINIEVQAQRDEDIAERTFTYNYRTYDRFKRPVVSVVVLELPVAERTTKVSSGMTRHKRGCCSLCRTKLSEQ